MKQRRLFADASNAWALICSEKLPGDCGSLACQVVSMYYNFMSWNTNILLKLCNDDCSVAKTFIVSWFFLTNVVVAVNLSIIPHTLGILATNIAHCIRFLEYINESQLFN